MSTNTAKQQEQQSAVPMVVSAPPEDAFMEHVLVGMAEFDKNLAREMKTSGRNYHRIHDDTGDTDQTSSAIGK